MNIGHHIIIGILAFFVGLTVTEGKPNKWVFYLPDDELVVDRAGCLP